MQAASLTAGELPYHLVLVCALEVEAPQIGASGHLKASHGQDVGTVGNRIEHCLVVRQRIARLIHEGQLDGLTQLDLAAIGLLLPGNHSEQGGLTRAVRTNDAHNRPGRHPKAQIVDQQPVAVRFADIVELQHLVAQALCDRNEDFLSFVALLIFVRREFLEPRHARLGLGLAALGVLAHPLQFFLDGFLARRFSGLFLL